MAEKDNKQSNDKFTWKKENTKFYTPEENAKYEQQQKLKQQKENK